MALIYSKADSLAYGRDERGRVCPFHPNRRRGVDYRIGAEVRQTSRRKTTILSALLCDFNSASCMFNVFSFAVGLIYQAAEGGDDRSIAPWNP
jgi:hypothetical protein